MTAAERYPDRMPAAQSLYMETDLGKYHALQCGDAPASLVMLHANGFNGGTYLPLLRRLAPHGGWLAPDFRGHGGSFTPEKIRSWHEFVADVATWKSRGWFQQPLVLGHSLGGVTALLTEAAHPGTFRGIVLLDPVVFRRRFLPVIALGHVPWIRAHNPMVKGALGRRMEFPDRNALVASYARKPSFSSWNRDFLEAYIQWGTHAVPHGVRLSCEKETEAQIFSTWPLTFWQRIRNVRCPVLILRGANSRTLLPATARRMEQTMPHAIYKDIDHAGHFLPMEQPDAVVAAVNQWQARQAV